MTHPYRAHPLSALPDLSSLRAVRKHQPAPPRMRQHVLPQSCPLPLSRASLRFTRPLKCVLRNRRPRRAPPRAISSLPKQAPKSSRYPTTSRHQFARANRHHHLQLQMYAQQKCRQNTTMRSVTANRKRLSSRKVFRLPHLSRLNKSLHNPLKR